jgi:hypothetical protein
MLQLSVCILYYSNLHLYTAANGLSYLFSRDRVFIVWRVRNRQMTTNALITDGKLSMMVLIVT